MLPTWSVCVPRHPNFRPLSALSCCFPPRQQRSHLCLFHMCLFRMSWRVGQCVVLAERDGRWGDDPPLPLPPPSPVWEKRWVRPETSFEQKLLNYNELLLCVITIIFNFGSILVTFQDKDSRYADIGCWSDVAFACTCTTWKWSLLSWTSFFVVVNIQLLLLGERWLLI